MSNEELLALLEKIDDLNDQIREIVFEISLSDHPKTEEVANALTENGFDNPADAVACFASAETGE
jgi:hypothetical protein